MTKHDENSEERTDGGDTTGNRKDRVPKGMKRYRIGTQNYYRAGVLYPAGTLVDIPADEEPSETWFELDGKSTRKVKAGAQGTKQLAENPNPMPDTPATSKSVLSSMQPIPADAKPVTADDDKHGKKK